MKTRRGPAGRGPSRKSRSFSRPILERVEDRLLLTSFTVNNTGDTGAGSLRQAILDSNGSTTALPNQIVFSLPSGLQTFSPVTSLPAITQSVTIDGTTQAGYNPLSPTPLIEIIGNNTALPQGPALVASAPNVVFSALVVDKFVGDGIDLNGGNDTVVGSWIGVDHTGSARSSNTFNGITVTTSNNTIGGSTLTSRNVISGNGAAGIQVSGSNATANVIQGNFIGTDATGKTVIGNILDGITLATSNNTVGGVTSLSGGLISGAGNVISNNATGITLTGANTLKNVIQGNFIGTDASGLSPMANKSRGVYITAGASNNTIGGATPAVKNIISANQTSGIEIASSTSAFNVVQGNYIGVGYNGLSPLGNGQYGVFANGSSNNLIGGTIFQGSTSQFGNIIAYSGTLVPNSPGVLIQGAQDDGILSNSIFANSGVGISLSSGNQGIQPPTNLSAQASGAQVRISGSFFGIALTGYRIQFFSSPTPDPSGSGEGMNFVGDLDVTTDSLGAVTFTTVLNAAVPVGSFLSATATQGPLTLNNTSEFSKNTVTTLAQVTDLGVTTGPTTQPLLNQNYTYAITVNNAGPNDATNVVLTDTIPTNSTFISSSAGTFGNGVLTDNIGNLADNASVTIMITVKPNNVATPFINTATVTGAQLDTNTSNNTSTTKLSVANNADLSVNLTASPNPTPIGSPVTYTLTIGNNGPSTANNTDVTVTLPTTLSNITVLPDQGSYSLTTNILTIHLGILPSSTSSTTTITGTPTAIGSIVTTASVTAGMLIDPNTSNNSQSVTVNVANAADLALSINSNPNPILVGQELLYTIDVTNNGPSTATMPVVTDQLPSNVNYVQGDSNAGGNGQISINAGLVTATLNALAPGDTDIVTIAVIPQSSGQLVNSATVADPTLDNSVEIDPDTTNNTMSTITQVSPADVGVTINNPADPLIIGTQAVYQVVVFNNGIADATNVTLVDSFGSNGTIVSSSVGQPSGGTLNVDLGTIPAGQSTTVTITVNPTASGSLVDSASVTSDQLDPDPNNNTTSSSNLVSPVDLAVTMTGSPNPILIGNQVVYVTTVTNNGPTTATNVLFNDTLPGASVLNSATTSQGVVTGGTGTVTGNLGTLAPGASAKVTILVTINAVSTATNTATVTSDGFDTNLTNNTASASVSVINLPGTIQVGTPLVIVGENAGSATITLNRVGGSLGTVTVNYSTTDYTAVAGVNYTAVSGVLTFKDGQTTASLTIPVIDDGKVDGNYGFFVNFSNATGGATLGSNNVASVLVTNTDRDMIPPSVTSVIGLPNGGSLNGFVVFFNKALDPARASDVTNYHVFLTNGGPGTVGETPIILAAANYSAATNSVTLVPVGPIPGNSFYRIVLNSSYGHVLTDTSGNVLAGIAGLGSNYDILYGQGTSLNYVDSQANAVSINVTGGGTIAMFRALSGDAAVLDLYGAVPHSTKLMGTVRKINKSSSGHTSITSIFGLGQFGDVQSNLETPPFYVINAPVGVTTLSGPTTVTAASVPLTNSVIVGKKTPKARPHRS